MSKPTAANLIFIGAFVLSIGCNQKVSTSSSDSSTSASSINSNTANRQDTSFKAAFVPAGAQPSTTMMPPAGVDKPITMTVQSGANMANAIITCCFGGDPGSSQEVVVKEVIGPKEIVVKDWQLGPLPRLPLGVVDKFNITPNPGGPPRIFHIYANLANADYWDVDAQPNVPATPFLVTEYFSDPAIGDSTIPQDVATITCFDQSIAVPALASHSSGTFNDVKN